jgi:CubicO group peptidase (beta-lactamase class C family)
VVSTLIGIAIDEGRLAGVKSRVLDLLPDREFADVGPDKGAMTVEDVLTMRTGLDWLESDATFYRMYQSRDWLGFVLDMRMAEQPGVAFRYCSGCSHVLSTLVQRATGANTYDYARAKLFEPLGIAGPEWERAPDGVPIGGWGLFLTPRDMAKLGYLFLNEGHWDGRQIVSAEWVRAATAKRVTADDGFGYGYQWWWHDRLDAYFARGRAGQLIFVVPGKRLVVVITADEMNDRPLLDLIERYVVAASQ